MCTGRLSDTIIGWRYACMKMVCSWPLRILSYTCSRQKWLRHANRIVSYSRENRRSLGRISTGNMSPWSLNGDIISYPLFVSAGTGTYPRAASQYHARPKAKRGIAMLSVDKFPYSLKQTRGTNAFHAQTFVIFQNIPAALKSSISLTSASQRQGNWSTVVLAIVTSWMTFLPFNISRDDVKCEIRVYISRLLAN